MTPRHKDQESKTKDQKPKTEDQESEFAMYAPANNYIPRVAVPESFLRGPFVVWSAAVVLTLSIFGLILVAPIAMANGHPVVGLSIYQAFSHLCHQIPARSFSIDGHPYAVCARCTGIYSGIVLGLVLYPLVRPLGRIDTPSRFWLIASVVPITVDFLLGYFNIWENTHISRLLTGMLFGAVAAFYVVPGLVDLSRSGWRRLLSVPANNVLAEQLPLTASSQMNSAPSDYGKPWRRI